MTPTEIAENAFQRINKKITNIVFLEIQNDRELMRHYLRCIENHGLDNTNQQIGKAVKQRYQLTNAIERDNDPSCTLIQSHQTFE